MEDLTWYRKLAYTSSEKIPNTIGKLL